MPEHRSDVQIAPSRCPRRAEIRVTSLSSVRMRRCRSREAKVARIMLGRSLRVADRTGCRLSGQGSSPCLDRRIRGTVECHGRELAADRSWRRGLPMSLRGRTTCDSARHDGGRLTPGHAVSHRLTSSHGASQRRPASDRQSPLPFVRGVSEPVSPCLIEPSHPAGETGAAGPQRRPFGRGTPAITPTGGNES